MIPEPCSVNGALIRLIGNSEMEFRARSVDTARLSPGSSFQYNGRVGVALVPCVAVMLGMGGKPVLGTLAIGLMISYILDSLQLKRGAFFGVWATVGATAIAYFEAATSFGSFVPRTLSILSFFLLMELVFVVGVWASLQFKWIQLENPSVVVALERLLFACIPFVAAAVNVWGVVAGMGLQNASFFLMAIQFVFYWMFSLPRPSSFKTKSEKTFGGAISSEALILGPLEACFHTLALIYLPFCLHVGIHHRQLFSVNVISELLLLFFLPVLFQLFASRRGALWWLVNDEVKLHQLRVVNGAICLFVVVLCLETRVVFHSFNHYIHLPPPWSYILVTSALLGAVSALWASLVGIASGSVLALPLIISALSGSLVIGMPIKFLPAPLICAVFLARNLTNRSLLTYSICVISATLSVTWFMIHNFWFLNIWVGGIPLKSICKFTIASTALAMSIPGLSFVPRKLHYLLDVGLIAQALIICQLENRLYNYTSMYYFGLDDDVVYPSYIVVATTALGLILRRKFEAEKRIGAITSWILFCLYTCKLSMLLLSSRDVVWVSAVLLLAISPPVLLYKDKSKGGRMKYWQALAHGLVIFSAVWYCRYTIFEALQWWFGRVPSDGFLLGSILLLATLASAPIVVNHFNHSQSPRRALVLLLATGLLLIFLEPPLPKAWTFFWDSAHMPGHLPDDEEIFGTVLVSPSWPTWFLLVTVVASLAAITSALPVRHFVELRLGYAVGVGMSMGVYVCAQFFPQVPMIHLFLVGAVVCASLFLVFVLLPSASSPRLIPWTFTLMVILLPIMYVLEGHAADGEEEKLIVVLALEGARTSLLGLYAAIFMLMALVIKLQLTSANRDKIHEKQKERTPFSNTGFVAKHHLLLQQRKLSSSSSSTVAAAAAEGAWLPAIGNISTVMCFGICVILNSHFTGGSDRAILFLAPILLLLNQDKNMLSGFGDRQRYFPLTAAISIYLIMCAAYRLWGEVYGGGGEMVFFAVKNILLLLLTLPNHVLFNMFLWNYVRQSDYVLLLTTPSTLPALVATELSSIRGLSLLSIIYALVQHLISRHIRIAGMRYI